MNKKNILITVSILIFSICTFLFCYSLYEYKQYSGMVSSANGVIQRTELSIDQIIYEWHVNDEYPLHMDIFLRNKSNILLDGELVFKFKASNEAVDEQFIKNMIEVYGSNELTKKDHNGKSPIFVAINNYIERGNKLENGKNSEPIPPDNIIKSEDYTFSFKKNISIKPGEIIKINQSQLIPLNQSGYLLSVEIDGIELKQQHNAFEFVRNMLKMGS